MSYLFKKATAKKVKKARAATVEQDSSFKPEQAQFKTTSKNRQQSLNSSLQGARRLRRVQLRGWK